MNSGNRPNWGQKNSDRRPWGGRGRGGFGGRDRGSRGGVNKNYRGHSFGNRGFRGGRQNDRGGRGGFQNWNKTPRDSPGKRLSEEEIGVTEYVNDHEGFLGVIKSRYSDFQVSEINLNGEIAKLTNLDVPVRPVDEDVEQDEDLLLTKYNVELLPMDVWDRINTLAVSEASSEMVQVDVEGMSKEQRTKIHDAVKKAFGEGIVGSTVTVDGKKMVRFEKYRRGVRIDNRVKWVWGGEHVHFIVHKENTDTMDAAQRIADRLRINLRPSYLGYAGTKDRRAKTSQWFSARRVDPRRLAQTTRDLRDIHIGNFTFSDTHLKLGMLKGNMFRIALRNVTAAEDSVETACRLLRDNGFVNYYGLQRFGTRADTPTYEIGKSMLKGDFQEAINGILRPRPGPLEHALQQYRAHGAGAALAAAARAPNAIELRLLKALVNQPKDLLGALNKVRLWILCQDHTYRDSWRDSAVSPACLVCDRAESTVSPTVSLARNTRLLYIHSYQSLVWNRAVSERIKRFGLKPAAGDLVPLSEVDDDIEDESDTEENGDDSQNGGDADITTHHPEKNAKKPEKDAKEPEKDAEPEKEPKEPEPEKKDMEKVPVKFPVKLLTQEDVDSGLFSIFDIIMPLPGHFIDYPPNMVDFYEEMLTKDGLTLELRNKIRSLNMSGAYRRLVTRPIDMSWSFVRYDSHTEDLILSDLDELNGVQLKETPEGRFRALLLTMSLPASCYATMALRELLKVDTSGDNQALQNNYHKKPAEDKGSEAADASKIAEIAECEQVEGPEENGSKRKLEGDDNKSKRVKQDE